MPTRVENLMVGRSKNHESHQCSQTHFPIWKVYAVSPLLSFCILEKKKKFLSFILEHKKKEPFLHACDLWKKEALWQSVILLKQEKKEE